MGRFLAVLGILAFAVSWFLPVHEGLGMSDELASTLNQIEEAIPGDQPKAKSSEGMYSGPPGWRACRFAWDLLTKENADGKPKEVKQILLGLTSVTNGLVVLALLALLARAGKGLLPFLGWALLVAGALNLGWIYWSPEIRPGHPVREDLQIGYWVWVGSFALIAIGLFAARPRYSVAPV